jgi:hypothetical protein
MTKVEFWFDRPQKICDILEAIKKYSLNKPITGDLSKGYGFVFKQPENGKQAQEKKESDSLFISEIGMSFEMNGGTFLHFFWGYC